MAEPIVHEGRQIGGAPVDGMMELWVSEGLPASCPLCKVAWRFIWQPMRKGWACPGWKVSGVGCPGFIYSEDLFTSYDGGDVFPRGYVRSALNHKR